MYISVKGYPKKDPNNSLPGQLAPDNQLPRSFIHYRAKRAAKYMTLRLNVIQIILRFFYPLLSLKIGGELSGANCPGGELSNISQKKQIYNVRLDAGDHATN